ncbi:MAG: hypothetical protein LBR44_12445, partial [Clostridiales Family XIII bacterium]|nr:hypothetical protein [Clostridiales Family XIII bacterium]
LDAAGQFYARGDKLTIEKGGHKAVITVQETTPIEYGSEGEGITMIDTDVVCPGPDNIPGTADDHTVSIQDPAGKDVVVGGTTYKDYRRKIVGGPYNGQYVYDFETKPAPEVGGTIQRGCAFIPILHRVRGLNRNPRTRLKIGRPGARFHTDIASSSRIVMQLANSIENRSSAPPWWHRVLASCPWAAGSDFSHSLTVLFVRPRGLAGGRLGSLAARRGARRRFPPMAGPASAASAASYSGRRFPPHGGAGKATL